MECAIFGALCSRLFSELDRGEISSLREQRGSWSSRPLRRLAEGLSILANCLALNQGNLSELVS